MRDMLNEMLSKDTGQDVARIASDTDRDFILSAAEAKDYGVIDEVIAARDTVETAIAAVGAA